MLLMPGREAYYRFQLHGDLFFGDIFLTDRFLRDETWAQGISACDLFFIIFSYNKKSKIHRLAIGS